MSPLTLQALRAQRHERVKRLEPVLRKFLAWAQGVQGHDLRLRDVEVDPHGRTLARYEPYFRGLRVDGPEVIGVVDMDDQLEPLAYPFQDLLVPTEDVLRPGYNAAVARQVAGAEPSAPVETVLEPILERLPLVDGSGTRKDPNVWGPVPSQQVVTGWRQVHRVYHRNPSGKGQLQTRVDVHSGLVLSSGTNGCSSPGTGLSQYSGQQTVGTLA